MRRLIYKLLRISNKIKANSKDKAGKRIGRRLIGKATGKGMRCLFK